MHSVITTVKGTMWIIFYWNSEYIADMLKMEVDTKAGGCFTPHITITNGLVHAGGRKNTGMTQIFHVHLWSPE